MWKFVRTGLKSADGVIWTGQGEWRPDSFQWKLGEWFKLECIDSLTGFVCSDSIAEALHNSGGEILCEVETRGNSFRYFFASRWEEVRIIRAWYWEKEDSVKMAIYEAESVIDLFEKEYPHDKKPHRAIEAAKTWLKNPTEENIVRANKAAYEVLPYEDSFYDPISAEYAARRAKACACIAAANSKSNAIYCSRFVIHNDNLGRIEAWIQEHIKVLKPYKE